MFGGDSRGVNAGVNLLTDTALRVEPVNAMPHMSAIPLNITRASGEDGRT